MTREKIVLVINILYLILYTSCSKREIIYSKTMNENVVYEKVHVNELLENLEKYDNKYVEVTGNFNMDIENRYIGYDKIMNRVWLDFNLYKPLKKDDRIDIFDELFQHRNSKVRVKGFLKSSISGHLGGYRAGITDISEFIVNPKN